jgi:hypothetical protein
MTTPGCRRTARRSRRAVPLCSSWCHRCLTMSSGTTTVSVRSSRCCRGIDVARQGCDERAVGRVDHLEPDVVAHAGRTARRRSSRRRSSPTREVRRRAQRCLPVPARRASPRARTPPMRARRRRESGAPPTCAFAHARPRLRSAARPATRDGTSMRHAPRTMRLRRRAAWPRSRSRHRPRRSRSA